MFPERSFPERSQGGYILSSSQDDANDGTGLWRLDSQLQL
jgi:hypothetical protein